MGFAAETDDVRAHAAAKLRAKDVDLLVVNDVSKAGIGFEADDNEVVLLDRSGGAVELPRMSKIEVAGRDPGPGAVAARRRRATLDERPRRPLEPLGA